MSALEILCECKFSDKFIPTEKNSYKRLLEDEQINMNPNKKDDNLAYASLELIDIPQLPLTILDVKQIPCRLNLSVEDLSGFKAVDKEFNPEV